MLIFVHYTCFEGSYLDKMSSGHSLIHERYTMLERKVPSLVDMCIQLAIDNIRHLGDVGETDLHLLERILPHCTVDQLKHIEDSTERDLSAVTDKLWKKFYEKEFGANSTNLVCERMKDKKVSFEWKLLYKAKLKNLEEAQQKSFDRIKELYKKEDAREFFIHLTCHEKTSVLQLRAYNNSLSHQEFPLSAAYIVYLCSSPEGPELRAVSLNLLVLEEAKSASKDNHKGGPGSNISNTKSSIMKKSKLQFLNSHEVTNLAAIKKNGFQKRNGISSMRKQGVLSGKDSASTSKPIGRRF
ncbi:hypothetical protein C3L33_10511, partial [Rhododendron williamsianum]